MFLIEIRMDGELKKEMIIPAKTPGQVKEFIETNKLYVFDFIPKVDNSSYNNNDDDDDDENVPTISVDMYDMLRMDIESEYWEKRVVIQKGKCEYKYIVTDTRNMVVVRFKDDMMNPEESSICELKNISKEDKSNSVFICTLFLKHKLKTIE